MQGICKVSYGRHTLGLQFIAFEIFVQQFLHPADNLVIVCLAGDELALIKTLCIGE